MLSALGAWRAGKEWLFGGETIYRPIVCFGFSNVSDAGHAWVRSEGFTSLAMHARPASHADHSSALLKGSTTWQLVSLAGHARECPVPRFSGPCLRGDERRQA